jgi:hypothetical protein
VNLLRAIARELVTRKRVRERQAGDDYATSDQFCRIFQEDMLGLYLLAFLLTASHEHAEQCFFVGMGDALKEPKVFKQWARSWCRRLMIKNAIHLIANPPAESREQPDCWIEANDESTMSATINAVTQLASFDRIVFVMSVLERYSVWECALLLDCSTRDIQAARIRALQELPALHAATTAG